MAERVSGGGGGLEAQEERVCGFGERARSDAGGFEENLIGLDSCFSAIGRLEKARKLEFHPNAANNISFTVVRDCCA